MTHPARCEEPNSLGYFQRPFARFVARVVLHLPVVEASDNCCALIRPFWLRCRLTRQSPLELPPAGNFVICYRRREISNAAGNGMLLGTIINLCMSEVCCPFGQNCFHKHKR